MLHQRYTVLALFSTIMIDSLGWGIAFPVLAPIILNNSTHLLMPDVGIVMRNFLYELSLGIYCIFMFFMSPILGSLSDKYGRKRILIISMMGNFLGFLISGFAIPAHSLFWILVGRSVAGGTAGSLPIAQAAMIDISEDSKKSARLGLVILASVTGFAVGPVIGGFFMDPTIFGSHISYQAPFFVSAAMGLLGAILLCIGFKETFVGNKQVKIHLFTSVLNLHQAFTEKVTKTYCIVLLCFLFGWGIFFSTLPVFLTERLGWNGALIGYFITYLAVAFAIMITIVLPRLTKLFSLPNIVLYGLSALLLCTFIFPTIHDSLFPWIAILLTPMVPCTYVSLVTLLSMAVDSQKQGQIMGVVGSIFALTWGVGPILGGFVLKNGFLAVYVMIGILFFSALILFSQWKVQNRLEKK